MKKFLTIVLFMAFTSIAVAQQSYQDVVYLKNGSIFRGTIIEQIPDKSIKIETADKNVFVYQMSEIEKITKEPIKGSSSNESNGSCLKKGYRGIVELGYAFGANFYSMDILKLNIINGYSFNPYLFLGFGTGLRYYFLSNAILLPLFADLRANFTDNKISPYLSLGFGYAFDATSLFKGGGLFLNPSAGVSFKISNKSSMNVGISYEIQKMKLYNDDEYYDYYIPDYPNTGTLGINVGFSF